MNQHGMAHLALSDNGFLFDTATGRTYTLNHTGTYILKRLIEGASFTDTVDTLTDRFHVSHDTAFYDAEEFIARLGELGIKTANSNCENTSATTQDT